MSDFFISTGESYGPTAQHICKIVYLNSVYDDAALYKFSINKVAYRESYSLFSILAILCKSPFLPHLKNRIIFTAIFDTLYLHF